MLKRAYALNLILSEAYSIAKDFINPDKASLREVEIDLATPADLQVSDNIKTIELSLFKQDKVFLLLRPMTKWLNWSNIANLP